MNILIDYGYREADMRAFPIEELAEFALAAEECPDNTEGSISFVDNDEMAELNEEYRGKVGPTDVLSFECDGLDDEEVFGDEGEAPIFTLGDVIIAPDVAEAQCASYGTTFEQEITLLLVHGLLHICGYDHIEDEDAAEMQQRERDILGAWFAQRGAAQDIQDEPIAYVELLAKRIAANSAMTPEQVEAL